MTTEQILRENILLDFACDLEDMNHSDFQGLAMVRAREIIDLVKREETE
jgi:hypothetical protein